MKTLDPITVRKLHTIISKVYPYKIVKIRKNGDIVLKKRKYSLIRKTIPFINLESFLLGEFSLELNKRYSNSMFRTSFTVGANNLRNKILKKITRERNKFSYIDIVKNIVNFIWEKFILIPTKFFEKINNKRMFSIKEIIPKWDTFKLFVPYKPRKLYRYELLELCSA